MPPKRVSASIGHFIRQFCGNPNAAWIGVASLDGLGGAPQDGLYRQGGRFRVASDLAIADGFIWMPDSSQDLPELWLSPTKAGYRAICERFARRYLGAPGLDGADAQIDYAFPKEAGRWATSPMSTCWPFLAPPRPVPGGARGG